MARKTNYAFERNARTKAKAEKREAKRQAKIAARTEDLPDESTPEPGDEGPPADDSAPRLTD